MVKILRTGHNRLNAHMFKKMKLAPSPICSYGLEDQTAEHTLQRCPLLQTARTKYVASGSPVTHQILRQKGGTGEDSYIHLADWTLSVAAIEKKKKKGWSSKPRLFPHTLTIGPPCDHGNRTTMLTGGMSDDPSITSSFFFFLLFFFFFSSFFSMFRLTAGDLCCYR